MMTAHNAAIGTMLSCRVLEAAAQPAHEVSKCCKQMCTPINCRGRLLASSAAYKAMRHSHPHSSADRSSKRTKTKNPEIYLQIYLHAAQQYPEQVCASAACNGAIHVHRSTHKTMPRQHSPTSVSNPRRDPVDGCTVSNGSRNKCATAPNACSCCCNSSTWTSADSIGPAKSTQV
jgi:hypothetical protein